MAVDISFFERIKQLKDRFIGEHPDALQQIAEWEKRIQKLSQEQEFFQFPVTQEMYALLRQRCKDHIIGRFKKGLKDADRAVLDARQAEIEWVLSLFNPNYSDELQTLDQLLDEEITNL